MKYIELGNNIKPEWWPKFINYVFDDSPDDRIITRQEWGQIMNKNLMKFGGSMHRDYKKNLFYITFRLDANYTMFVLKFT